MFQTQMFQTPAMQSLEDMASFNQANLEAAMTSTSALTRGLEGYNRACFDFARSAYERGVAAVQAMAQAKSPEQAVELQSDYARKLVDDTVAQGKMLSDLCIDVANQATAPVQARVDAAMATLGLPKAA
jgi:phasin family protein